MTGVGAGSSLPNGAEGWGRVNMQYMLNTGVSMKHFDQTTLFVSPGDNIVIPGRIADASKPFRATLVWTDPPGANDPSLVNDLNLSVNIGGNTFVGNNFTAGQSTLGGTADNRNNVEQVWRSGSATNTQVSVTVTAASLNGDGVLGNGDTTDQNFALVLYNFEDAPLTQFGLSGRVVDANGRGIKGVSMSVLNGSDVVATTLTNSFGYFAFWNITGNQTYTLAAKVRRYRFDAQVVNLGSADLTGLNFTPTVSLP
jgi:hypothetical protein